MRFQPTASQASHNICFAEHQAFAAFSQHLRRYASAKNIYRTSYSKTCF